MHHHRRTIQTTLDLLPNLKRTVTPSTNFRKPALPCTTLSRPIFKNHYHHLNKNKKRSFSTISQLSKQLDNMSLFPRYHAPNYGNSSSSSTLSPFWRLLEDPFFVPASSTSSTTGRQMFQPKFDVHETPEAFVLDGELPGITDKNALDIHFADQQTLVIHGRVESIRKSGPDERSPSRKPTVEDADESGETSKEVSKKEESGEVSKHQQQSGHRVWIQERSVGEFQRSFNFPAGIDQDNVKASLKDGILSITVPKMQQKAKRKINIE